MKTYDIITVGGGLGGAALAKAMAERGADVLVLERETRFKDRVRGEQVCTWGAAEARELGVYDLLTAECAHELPWWDTYVGPARVDHRDLLSSTPQQLPNLTFFHPEMQETLLGAAADAGAEVWRGARATDITPGPEPVATVQRDGMEHAVGALMIVGAGGRASVARKWGGFEENQDPQRLQIAGLLFDGLEADPECAAVHANFALGSLAILFPQGGDRVRAYVVSRVEDGVRLHGDKDVHSFVESCLRNGIEASLFDKARPSGPLATFDGADSWVEHPYRDGVALIGDAAATSDPAWGQGLSLTLRDARTLRDHLLSSNDWDTAGHAYAEEHDHYYTSLRTVEDWFTRMFYDKGPEADMRRARVLAGGARADSFPDPFQSGPDSGTWDEATRRRFFGEE